MYPDLGGLETYAYELGENLAKKNNKITIICSYKNKSKAKFHNNITLKRIKYDLKFSNTPVVFGLYRKLIKICKKNRYDLIISHTPVPYFADIAALIARNKKIPHIIIYHCGSLYKKSFVDLLAWIYEQTIERITLNSSDKIVVFSKFVKDYLSKKRIKRVKYIKMGFDIPKKFPKKNSSKKNILFVGNLDRSHRWKGIEFLIKAMKIVQKRYKCRLIIAGEGNFINHYKKIAQKLKVDIYFAGKKDKKGLKNLYLNSKLLVLPSTSNAESFGRVIIEAAAYGVPSVGSDIGGIPDVINDNVTGMLVKPKDIEGLAKKIEKLIENKKLYGRLSHNAYKYAKDYNWNKSIKKIGEIIKDVTNKP